MLRAVPAGNTTGVGDGVGVGVGVSAGVDVGELSGVASDLGFGAGLGFGLPGVALPSGEGSGGADVSLGGVGLVSCWLDADCFSLALLVRQPGTSSNMAMMTT